jgi:prepilin-type N-terminal cleavage/methylation domain-containing protein
MTNSKFYSARSLRNAMPRHSSGFTLIELMVAMTVFLVIGGAAMSLFRSHADLFNTQQGEVGLNMNLRNALSQIQTDAVQAGNGFYIGGATSTANTPVGITITNNAGSFDSLTLIQASTPAIPISGACATTNTGTAVLAGNLATPPVTAANLAAGSEIMFMNGNGNQMTVAKLSGATAGAGGTINITYGATQANGTNTGGATGNDPFNLTWTLPPVTDPDQLTDQFCPSNGDYIVGLSYVTYSVNNTNQLIRTTAATALNPDIIADQIIGFKVGAATYQALGAGNSTSTPAYSFNASSPTTATPPGYNNQFSLIRSIRVSLIGRTPPGQFTGSAFRNSFDGNQYRIQALSLVINPRNLSMND